MLLKFTVYIEIACFYDGNISKEVTVVIISLSLEKSWSSQRMMKEFPQKGCSRASLGRLIQKLILIVQVTGILVA